MVRTWSFETNSAHAHSICISISACKSPHSAEAISKKDATTLKKELERMYWNTWYKNLSRNLFKAFVEELGQEYDASLEGAVEDEQDIDVKVGEDESDKTLLNVAVDRVKASIIGEDGGEDEGDEEDEDFWSFY